MQQQQQKIASSMPVAASVHSDIPTTALFSEEVMTYLWGKMLVWYAIYVYLILQRVYTPWLV